jgi:hypothetical protein
LDGRHNKKHRRRNPPRDKPPASPTNAQLSKQKTEPEPSHTPEEPTNDEENMNWKLFQKPDPFDVAVYGLVIAFLVAVVYFLQLRAMLNSNDINRESLQSVQRAFIAYRGMEKRRGKQGDVMLWEFSPTYENSGTTPALAAVSVFSYGEGGGILPEEEFREGRLGVGKLPVSTVAPKATQPAERQLLQESYVFGSPLGDDLGNFPDVHPKSNLYFWGWMTYRDVFRGTKTHLTEFCRHMGPPQMVRVPPQNAIRFNYEVCAQHNCTDENCPDYAEVVAFSESRQK